MRSRAARTSSIEMGRLMSGKLASSVTLTPEPGQLQPNLFRFARIAPLAGQRPQRAHQGRSRARVLAAPLERAPEPEPGDRRRGVILGEDAPLDRERLLVLGLSGDEATGSAL